MRKAHNISDLSLKGTRLHMFVDGNVYDVDLAKESYRFSNASTEELKNVEVSPAGYGLHWPDLDEDLSIDGLIGVQHESCLLVAEKRDKYGFTLLEVLVAMAILMIIVLMMATLFHQSSMAWNNGLRQAQMSIQARAAMSMMRRDLSQAVASQEYPCNFSANGFSVYVLGTTTGDVRAISQISYSFSGSTINRYKRSMKTTAAVGDYGKLGAPEGGKFLDYVSKFKVKTYGGSPAELPEWVDLSITLEKTTIGAAGIKVWSNGRDKMFNTEDDRDKLLRTWKN